jgi:hypothetical protein
MVPSAVLMGADQPEAASQRKSVLPHSSRNSLAVAARSFGSGVSGRGEVHLPR